MPSQRKASTENSRAKMLNCGRRIVARSGLRGLTVRGVAAQAKVNLGTFVYHFGTREAFIAELMESWYAPLYAQLSVTVDEQLQPLEKIRRFLLQLAGFMLENRRFVRHVLMDATGGEEPAIRFVKSLFGRHPQLLFRLVRDAQTAGELQQGDPMKLGVCLFGATLFPAVWVGVLLPKGFIPKEMEAQVQHFAAATEEIEQRFEWVLDGLRPVKRRAAKKSQNKTMEPA